MKYAYIIGGLGLVIVTTVGAAVLQPHKSASTYAKKPVGVVSYSGKKSDTYTAPKLTEQAAVAAAQAPKEQPAVVEATPSPKIGSYELFNDAVFQKAQSGHVVLFFAASWCHTCKALNQDIESHLSAIPGNVTISKVDYDSSTALKQKYGVTYQHVLVEVDAQGNLIKKWAQSPTLQDVLAEI